MTIQNISVISLGSIAGWNQKDATIVASRDLEVFSVTPWILEDAEDPVEAGTLSLSICSTIKAVAAGKEDIGDHMIPCLEA